MPPPPTHKGPDPELNPWSSGRGAIELEVSLLQFGIIEKRINTVHSIVHIVHINSFLFSHFLWEYDAIIFTKYDMWY